MYELVPGASQIAREADEPAPSGVPPLSPQRVAELWIAIAGVPLASLAYFFSRHLTNTYGDALAHMEGARRLWDSLTPGYAEIGTVWLPLFHILTSPLTASDYFWRTGLAGSLVSTVSFALTCWLLFRLALEINRSLAAGLVALATCLFCPNMLYLASTPLTEPLALLWSVATVYALFRFRENGRRGALVAAGLSAFFGTLTRYDIWYLLPFAFVYLPFSRPGPWQIRLRQALLFGAMAGFGPLLWIAHNTYHYGNPIEFYNGPYSAMAIYAHQIGTTGFRYPTDGSLLLSARYYVADLVLVIGLWPLALAILGLIAFLIGRRQQARRSAGLLLLVLLPFYIQAMAHSAVPLYVPTLFPNTYYNLRYGMEMLPGVAILVSYLVPSAPPVMRDVSRSNKIASTVSSAILFILPCQALAMVARGPRELGVAKEGILNSPCRSQTGQAIIRFFHARYDGEPILMAAGKNPCVLPQLDIPIRQTISESNRPQWRLLRLGADRLAGWIIRGQGDTVDAIMRAYPSAFSRFMLTEKYQFPDEEPVEIYRRTLAIEPGIAGAVR